MYISARADYAMRALLVLASDDGSLPLKGETLARDQGMPVKFVEKCSPHEVQLNRSQSSVQPLPHDLSSAIPSR